MDQYETVFIGYPNWALNVPQAVLSFLSAYDLSVKTVVPFCTHDGYGAGSSFRSVQNAASGAKVLDDIVSLLGVYREIAARGVKLQGYFGSLLEKCKIKGYFSFKFFGGTNYCTTFAASNK